MKFGNIFKGLLGAGIGFLGSGGNPIGAVVGGLGGLFGSKGSGGNNRIGVYTPPTTQEAYNIVKGLESKAGDITKLHYDIEKPYIDEAYNIFKQFPNTVNNLFGDTENSIKNRYNDLFNSIQTQMNNQWSKQALGLSALGMYNTPASTLTQSDIVNQLFGRIKEAETQSLTAIDNAKLTSLLDYYSKAPSILSGFGETYANLNPEINLFKTQLDLASVLNNLSANSVLYPKASPLQQAGDLLTSIVGMSKNLPSWDKISANFITGFHKIFG
jgi:gas vesicle protein